MTRSIVISLIMLLSNNVFCESDYDGSIEMEHEYKSSVPEDPKDYDQQVEEKSSDYDGSIEMESEYQDSHPEEATETDYDREDPY